MQRTPENETPRQIVKRLMQKGGKQIARGANALLLAAIDHYRVQNNLVKLNQLSPEEQEEEIKRHRLEQLQIVANYLSEMSQKK